VPAEQACALTITADAVSGATVLTTNGVLDTSTYRSLRDGIIKAAIEEPRAVIVDVAQLTVPAESAWAAITSARWHVRRWPAVPIALVCEHRAGRSAIARSGVARYVSVYPTVSAALAALSAAGDRPHRHRARAYLPADLSSLRRSRELVEGWLKAWSHVDLIPVSKVIVTAFVENVLQHTDSRPNVRLETDGAAVTVAVEDASRAPASLSETMTAGDAPSGLRIVAALCRTWGNAPTPAGKTVWAVVGPENRL
jgi:anti-anti-sigma regulatory factor